MAMGGYQKLLKYLQLIKLSDIVQYCVQNNQTYQNRFLCTGLWNNGPK